MYEDYVVGYLCFQAKGLFRGLVVDMGWKEGFRV